MTPLTIISPSGEYVRSDNTSSPAYAGNGTGSTPQEQYIAYHPNNTSDTSSIDPYESILLKSVETGLWCQLRPLPSNSTQIGMICDQATPATATPMTFTGSGLSYNGIDLVASAPGQPLLLENTTSAPVAGGSTDDLTIAPALTGALRRCVTHAPDAELGLGLCAAAARLLYIWLEGHHRPRRVSRRLSCMSEVCLACLSAQLRQEQAAMNMCLAVWPACRPGPPARHAPQAARPLWQHHAQ